MYERIADPDSEGVFHGLAPDDARRTPANMSASLDSTPSESFDPFSFALPIAAPGHERDTATTDQAVI